MFKLIVDDGTGELLVYTMIASIIPVIILYFIRTYQIIIGQHYSHFFIFCIFAAQKFYPSYSLYTLYSRSDNMKIKNILISQPEPTNGSPYSELISKHKINIDFIPFFRVESLTAKEFRLQKVSIPEATAVVFLQDQP